MLIFAGVICFSVWLYLALGHGGFWRVSRLLAPEPGAGGTLVSVAAVVPARDEADVIGQCVTSLLSQSAGDLHVFLIDDGSRDNTAAVARRAAEASSKSDRLVVVPGKPLPAGWSGKLWAVHQGVERARALNPDFLLLTDADIVHAPDNVSRLMAIAEAGGHDLVSLMVKLHCATLAERVLIPAFVFFFFQLYPPAWIADPRRKTAGAAGGCMLIRPQALERAGGIESIRQEIIDDCALARRVKNSGGKVWLGLTEETRSIRPYGSFGEIGRMISRSAFNQLGHSVLLLALCLFGLATVYLLPPALVLSGRLLPAFLGASTWGLMSLCFLPIVRFYRCNALWSLALPLIAAFYMGATLHSAIKFWMGRGGEWKGRVQDRGQLNMVDSEQAERLKSKVNWES